ncbi:MAG: ABC transporter substrate-binding protein [Rhodococcus sp. (in: high G+C Gram-positive bacteria)]
MTISTESGDVIIESAPERIVTLGNPAFENVVALGSHPVAASMTNIDKLPYLADYVGNEALDESLADIYAGQVNFERMLAVEPDLIIAPAWPVFTEPATLERLRTIAPTLIFDMQDADNDWRVGVQQVADALGKSEQGQALISAAVDEFTGVAAATQGLAKRPYSFGLYYKEQISLGSGGNILRLFGMRPAEDQATVESTGTPVTYSGETAGDVDGEAVLLMPSPLDSIASLEQSPFWESNLKPRVVWLSDAQGEAINNAGVLGKTWLPGNLGTALSGLG